MKTAGPVGRLTNDELHARLCELVARERRITLCVIDHLIEVGRRRLHLIRGFSSLFAYCAGDLGYSNAAAARRVAAVRAIERFPRVRGMIARRELSLSTLSLISGEMRAPDAGRLIDAIKGKSRREAEAVLAAFRGPVVQRERIRPVVVAVASKVPAVGHRPAVECTKVAEVGIAKATRTADAGETVPTTGQATTSETALAAGGSNGREAGSDRGRRGPDSTQAAFLQPVARSVVRRMFRFEFAGDGEFFRKYQRAEALLSNCPDAGTIEFVMNRVFDVFLEQKDPARRDARRQKRRERAAERAAASQT